MQILMIAKAFPPVTGGIETYSQQVARAYLAAGHEVMVLTAYPGKSGRVESGGLAVVNVGEGGGQPGVFLRMVLALVMGVGRGADFVHATSWRVALPAMLIRPGIRRLITVHGREVFVVPKPLQSVMRWTFRRAHAVVAVSRPILDLFVSRLGFAPARATVAWNGVSFGIGVPRPAHQGALKIFCLCRLVERKNLPEAIRALRLVADTGMDFSFHIAGSGAAAAEIDAAIAEEGLGDRVRRLGRVSDEEAISLYREADIFLHPQIAVTGGSDLEGFGISIADAMAFGAVPIAGSNGGPADFIRHGETGLLVDGTDRTAIAGAVLTLARAPELRAQISARGLHFAEGELTWAAHVRRCLAVLAD